MALNIFPRRRETAQEAAAEAPQALPEPSPEALSEAEEPRRPAARRTRTTRAAKETAEAVEAATPAEGEAAEEAPKPARRSRARAAKPDAPPEEPTIPDAPELGGEAVAELPPDGAGTTGGDPAAEQAPSRRRRGGRGRGGRGAGAAAPGADGAEPAGDEPMAEPARALSGAPGDISMLVRAIDRQTRQLETHSRQIEQLLRTQERGGAPAAGGGGAVANRPRVAIFVDVANVELASDRLRARFDWGKILDMLTAGRQLVRAVAYSPVHDDPQVSIETQRFVEPFLDKGYKIVTKPLKRFQDGTIKANVDLELALDVMAMLDRLDVVCLVSGDGDFQRLVEVVQARGIQVDVVSVGQSTAANLRHAADHFIDLGARLRDIRV